MSPRTLSVLLLCLSACVATNRTAEIDVAMKRADSVFLMGDYAKAVREYEEILDSDPGPALRPVLLLRIARCRLGERRWNEARDILNQSLAGGADAATRLEILSSRAVTFNATADYAAALRDLLQIASAPDGDRGRAIAEDEFRYRLGLARIRCGEWAEGKRELSRVDPKGPQGEDAALRLQMDSFAVQVGRFNDPEAARRFAQDLEKSKGLRLRVTPGPVFYVLSGSFPTIQSAQKEAANLRDLGIDGAFPLP